MKSRRDELKTFLSSFVDGLLSLSLPHTLIFLGIAGAYQALLAYVNSVPEFDEFIQTAAAVSLLDHRGLTTENGLVLAWPPGYSLLIAGIYGLTGSFLSATILLRTSFTLLFSWSWLLIAHALSPYLSRRARGCLLFYFSFLCVPSLWGFQTDGPAVACLTLALAFSLGGARSELDLGKAVGIGVCLLSAILLRYLYWPVALLMALGLLRHYRGRGNAWFALLIPVLPMVVATGLAVFGKKISLSAQIGSNGQVYWENLLRFSTFPADLLTIFLWSKFKISQWHFRHPSWAFPVRWLITLGFVALSLFFWNQASRKFGKDPLFRLLSFMGWSVSLATVCILMFLSVRAPVVQLIWTYVFESRYFIPVVIFAVLPIWWGAFSTDTLRSARLLAQGFLIFSAASFFLYHAESHARLLADKPLWGSWRWANKRYSLNELMPLWRKERLQSGTHYNITNDPELSRFLFVAGFSACPPEKGPALVHISSALEGAEQYAAWVKEARGELLAAAKDLQVWKVQSEKVAVRPARSISQSTGIDSQLCWPLSRVSRE